MSKVFKNTLAHDLNLNQLPQPLPVLLLLRKETHSPLSLSLYRCSKCLIKRTVKLLTCQSEDIAHNQIGQYHLAKDKWKLDHPNVPFRSHRYKPRHSTRPSEAFLHDLDNDLERFENIGNNNMVTDDEPTEEESDNAALSVEDSDDGNDDDDGDDDDDGGYGNQAVSSLALVPPAF